MISQDLSTHLHNTILHNASFFHVPSYVMVDFLHIMVLHHVLIIRTSRCQKHYEHLEIKENKYRKEVDEDRKGFIYSVLFDHPSGLGNGA